MKPHYRKTGAIITLLFTWNILASHDEPRIRRQGSDSRTVLLRNGFRDLECSQLFERRPYVVTNSENFPIYFPIISEDFDFSRLQALAIESPSDDPPLLYIQSENQISTYQHSGAGITQIRTLDENTHPGINPRAAMETQLTRAGFAQDPGGCGVFRRRFGETELIAVMKQGRLMGIYFQIRNPLVVGATLVSSSDSRGLRLRNQNFSFSLQPDGTLDQSSFTFTGDLRNTRPTALTHVPFQSPRDRVSHFQIGGVNTTETINRLSRINGIPISNLENEMRPGESSTAGFLGREERLLDVLARDNNFVLSRNLTHQQIAEPMHIVRLLAENLAHQSQNITYNGQRLQISAEFTRGGQPSPFEDGTSHNANVTVKNLDTNTIVRFGLLLPYMIERYGFYEGRGTSYRVEPEQLIKVFGLGRR